MKKREASQHSPVEAWVRYFLKENKRNCKVEIKHSRGESSFPFAEVEQHQIDDLVSFENLEPFVHKFDDTGYREKPCDVIGVIGGSSFFAVRYNDFIAIISINVWLNEQSKKDRKSITASRAREIAYDVIEV